ncbi:hypothetical protein [Pedobacter gandavensis]|uniref:Uncharacterized protein n=1 Tax=Pedobacter gandavensis TaxID=2679963 RepID=A0ABR6EV46_9SPHI|nr:hypothetical protein [Pedobacter gandavensis]MBB2148846.1 hypothetical protein [Pedobacter gandavensis]
MQKKEKLEINLEIDPNKLDSNIKSFEDNGNHYLYICHIDKYSDKVGGHPDDRSDQVKLMVKSFYGKYLDMDVPLKELNTPGFNDQLIKSIEEHLISTEPSY